MRLYFGDGRRNEIRQRERTIMNGRLTTEKPAPSSGRYPMSCALRMEARTPGEAHDKLKILV
tara:strand:+ start:431 stop:616 length:186 start_codon:yes stop_codon:yes gene_type:complete